MDDSTPVASWSTPTAAAVALIGAGIALAVAATASYTEPPAMVFIGIAALGLLAAGTISLIRRPRLALRPGPVLEVRAMTGRVVLTSDAIERISILNTRRLASRSKQLIIDLPNDKLLVFGRWDLGVNPVIVAQTLRDAGFPVDVGRA